MMFDDRALASIVARTLADSPEIPEGAHGAVVLVGNQESAKVVVAVRVHEGWKIEAVVETPWNDLRHVTYGAKVTGVW